MKKKKQGDKLSTQKDKKTMPFKIVINYFRHFAHKKMNKNIQNIISILILPCD